MTASAPQVFTRDDVIDLRDHTLISLLRVLQKVTKGCSAPLKAMVRVKSPNVLLSLLEHENELVTRYTLKLFKSQMKYLGAKWKNGHMDVISKIYCTLPMKLNDTWMTSETPDNAPNVTVLAGD